MLQFDADGFVLDFSPPFGYIPFHTLPEFTHCCRPILQPLAERLAGRCLFPRRSPTDVFELQAVRYLGGSSMSIRVANRLTPKSALGLLHFLHHAAMALHF